MENELTIQLRDNAKEQLAQIKTIEGGVDYLNKVKAIEIWARAEKKDAELQNIVAEQKIRTQRILGQLLKENEVGKNFGKGTGSNQHAVVTDNDHSLSSYGINKNDSSAFQKIASLPDELFESEIQEAKQDELTTSRILNVVKEYKQQQKKEKAEWTDEEQQLLKKVKASETVLINMNKHLKLLKYAEDNSIYERIDRFTEWGNPFIVDEDGTREEVCYWFEHYYFPYKKSLHKKLQRLRGKILGCHCYPNKCHGETYIKYLEDNEFDFENC